METSILMYVHPCLLVVLSKLSMSVSCQACQFKNLCCVANAWLLRLVFVNDYKRPKNQYYYYHFPYILTRNTMKLTVISVLFLSTINRSKKLYNLPCMLRFGCGPPIIILFCLYRLNKINRLLCAYHIL